MLYPPKSNQIEDVTQLRSESFLRWISTKVEGIYSFLIIFATQICLCMPTLSRSSFSCTRYFTRVVFSEISTYTMA